MHLGVLATQASETGTPPWCSSWLSIDDDNEDAVLVRVIGGVSADRSDELWSALEMALQQAVGRLVIIDLARVTGFDAGTLETLNTVSRAASRWHLGLCAVVEPFSSIAEYAESCGLRRFLPTYRTADEAIAAITARSA